MLQSLLEDATKMLVQAFIWDYMAHPVLIQYFQVLNSVSLPYFAALFYVEFVHLQSPGLLECSTDNVYQQMQSLQSASVRLIMQTGWHEHITPGQHIVEFKLTILLFNALLVYYCHICEMNVIQYNQSPCVVWVRGFISYHIILYHRHLLWHQSTRAHQCLT